MYMHLYVLWLKQPKRKKLDNTTKKQYNKKHFTFAVSIDFNKIDQSKRMMWDL